MISPIEALAQARQVADTMAATRNILVFGIEPNIRKYQTDHAQMLAAIPIQSYNEAIAGVFADDPAYTDKLASIEVAIADLHASLQDVLDKIGAIRALNPLLLPNPYPDLSND